MARQVAVMWCCAAGNALLAVPINTLFGTWSDWLRWGVYVAIVACGLLISRRNAGLGVWLHLVGAMGLLMYLMLDPTGFAARISIGALGYGILLAPILIGLSTFLGISGTITGWVFGWASLVVLTVLGGFNLAQSVFIAFQIAFVSLTGYGVHHLLHSLEQARHKLECMTLIDELTGLGNRRGLIAEFERYASLASRQDVPLIVSSWDVNDLKRINDSMGHAIGDAYLQRFARTLQNAARLEDAFFRVGGDEFVGLHLGLEDGSGVIERVRSQFGSVSAGWALGKNGLEMALSEADRQMYLDKAQTKSGQDDFFRDTREFAS